MSVALTLIGHPYKGCKWKYLHISAFAGQVPSLGIFCRLFHADVKGKSSVDCSAVLKVKSGNKGILSYFGAYMSCTFGALKTPGSGVQCNL